MIVTSTAEYRGKLDSSDEDAIWIINTHLNTSLGGELYDWEFPDWTGIGATGKGVPYTRYIITCDLACGADAAVDKCDPQDENVAYLGHSAAGIYHVRGPGSEVPGSGCHPSRSPGGPAGSAGSRRADPRRRWLSKTVRISTAEPLTR